MKESRGTLRAKENQGLGAGGIVKLKYNGLCGYLN